jgi:hypothetical protein
LAYFTIAYHWSRSCAFPFRSFLPAASVESFSVIKVLYGVELLTVRLTLNMEDQVIPFVWIIVYDLLVVRDATSIYATASIALRVI